MITTPPPTKPNAANSNPPKFGVAPAPLALEPRRRLARSFHVEGKRQQAAEAYAQLLQANARDVEALEYLAHFHLDTGGYQHACNLLQALLAVQPQNQAARYHFSALQALIDRNRALPKYQELYQRMLGPEDGCLSRGLRREQIPVLTEMNGDPLWLPGDLLRYLWHTVRQPLTSSVPSFLAETDHYQWVRARVKPGDDVLDIGSNLGIFATMMGARVGAGGRVFAFEPSARIAGDLRRVLALNDLAQVTVTEAAVSDRNGEATFCEIQEGDVRREGSHLSDPVFDQVTSEHAQARVTVRTLVLDEFAERHAIKPALMKIDVEGAEYQVLAGAEKTIGTYRPILVIELHPFAKNGPIEPERLCQFLARFGYEHRAETKTYYCWPKEKRAE